MKNKINKRDLSMIAVGTAFVGLISWLPVSSLNKNSVWVTKANSIAKGVQSYQENGLTYSTRCNLNVINKAGDVEGKPDTFQMLTNGHCDNRSDSNSYKIHFANGNVYDCSAEPVVKSEWEHFDFMVINCKAKKNVVERPIEIDVNFDLKTGTRLAHISWNCNYFADSQCKPIPMIDISNECKVINPSVKNVSGIENSLSQGCDSQGGSSGSALHAYFDKEGNVGGPVVALHNSEVKGVNHHITGEGPENRSIHIGKVVNEIHRQDPTIKFYHFGEENFEEEPISENPFDNKECKQKSLGDLLIEFLAKLFS